MLDVSKEGKEEVFYGPTLPFASNGIAACFLPAPYFTCPNLQTLQVPHHRIGTMWDKERVLHKIRCGRGKIKPCVLKGFFGSVKIINPHGLLLYLHTFVLKSDHNRQEGSYKNRGFSPLPQMQRHICESIWHFCWWLLAACLDLISLCNFVKALWMLSAPSWAAVLWNLHVQLFTNGTFKDERK